MDDLGPPASYLTLEEGTAVYTSDGEELGSVNRVVADPALDVFEGIVVRERGLPPVHRWADGEQVDEICERGVVLTVSAAEAKRLPEYRENR